MRELDVCQHFSDQLDPSCPDQDDISVWSMPMVRNLKTSFFDAMAAHDVVAREG
jgi:hypothetical protein